MSYQLTVEQTGTITPGHVASWTTNGVIQDGGTPSEPAVTSVGIINTGGTAVGVSNAPVTGAYSQFGLGFVPASNTFQITLNSYNGAPAATLEYVINGVTYSFPGTGTGNVIGPSSAVSGNLAAFNGTSGTLIEDSGVYISSAMVPVVEASSTGAALTALGINSAVQPALAESTAAQALAALDGPLPLASIAALRAYTGVATPVLNVEHWFDGDDGGGQGLFWYNASDTTSADNSGTIIIDGSNRRWYRLTNGEPLNILWFGAYPNSSSDSATALNAALAALPTAGGAIYIPAGTYTFGSTITYTMLSDSASLTIIGDGPEVTLLTWAASNGLKVECISAFNSVRIRDMTLLTGAANTYTGIDLTQSATISNPANTAPSDITNVNLRGADAWGGTDYWEVGINVVSVSNINFVNVDITGTNASAYASDGDGIKLAGTSSSIAVVFNFIGCTFNVLGGGITNGTYAQGITISQCNFTGCGVGISVPTSVTGTAQLAVSDSQFNCDTGIYTLSAVTQTMIANNLFIVPQSGNGIQMSDVASATITGNTFGPTSVDNTAGDGIIINSTVSGEPGAVITGNAFWSIPQVGVVLEASASYCNVQSNNYLGCGTNTDNLGSNNTVGGGSA